MTQAKYHDFGDMHQRMQKWVDDEFLPCCATVVMHGNETVDVELFGYMDLETREPLRADAIYRMYSNTKLITSVAAMMLFEQGRFALDDPIEMYLPEFSDMRVLRPGADSLDETVPAEHSITPRHLLSHTSGLSYGFIEPESLIDQGYTEAGIDVFGDYDESLVDLSRRLGEFPLAFQPGSAWKYSFATDVVGRLIEVLSGEHLDDFFEANIFSPLEMVDTAFHVPVEKQHRFVTMYTGPDPLDYDIPGLIEADNPHTGHFSKPRKLLMAGGGLVSTVQDYSRFIEMLVAKGVWRGQRIIGEGTLQLMLTNQLPAGAHVGFPDRELPGMMFGLGFSLIQTPGPQDPPGSESEYGWAGMAGTATWINPDKNLAGLSFTQRLPAGAHPSIEDFRRFVYASAQSEP